MAKRKNHIIRFEDVRDRIITLRGQNVILDFAVADLYGVETREINQAVKNNPKKFPKGWIFEVEKEELEILRSKISTTNVVDNQTGTALRSKNLTLEEDLQSNILTANLPSPKSRVMPKAFTAK